jgi:antitoxin ParD1/3/4
MSPRFLGCRRTGIELGGKICYQMDMTSKVQKISVALTPELNSVVTEAVESGQFASASEVMRDALRLWRNREELRAEALAHMRALIQEGIDSGPGEEWDVDKMRQELHAEFAARSRLKKSA